MIECMYDQIRVVNDIVMNCGHEVGLIDIIGFEVYDHLRYPGTPPEMALVGGDHCDGGQWGYIEHCPELPGIDTPFAYYCPGDTDDGVRIIARNSTDIVSMCLSRSHYLSRVNREFARLPIIEKCLSAIKGTLVDYYSLRYADDADKTCRLESDLLGHHYVMTPDNVGLYVKGDYLNSYISHSVTYNHQLKQTYRKIGLQALDDNH